MSTTEVSQTATAEVQNPITAELKELQVFFVSVRQHALAVALALIAMSGWLAWYAPGWLASSWGVGCLTGLALLMRLGQRYRRVAHQPLGELQHWRHVWSLAGFIIGAVFGSVVLVAFPHLPLTMKLLCALLAMAVNFIAASVLPLRGLLVLLVTAIPPTLLGWMLWGESLDWPMVCATVAFLPVYLLVCQEQRRATRDRADLSERQQHLAQAMARHNASLESANRAKTSLLAAASHDLRQPVHALGMVVELIHPDDPRDVRRRLASVHACVDTLSEMLTQLLDFNRLDLGLYAPSRSAVMLGALLNELRHSIEPMVRAKGIRLRMNTQPLVVRSDAQLLRRLVLNLVTNAIKFTPCGHISIATWVHEGEVHLSVSDTGVGIAPELINQVFGEYVSMPQSHHTGGEEGLGLGLSIVRKGVDLLGHHVRVESKLGEGTCFTLELGELVPAGINDVAAGTASLVALPQVEVAVIEDDPFVLDALLGMLEHWGCRPQGARSLGELGRINCPALLVSDMHLANNANGLDVIEQLRQQFGKPTLPAILLTGDLDPLLEQRSRAAGVVLAHKPMRPAILRDLVGKALSHGTY